MYINRAWGFLRETRQGAMDAGIDKDTGVCRTGLDEYLEVIFPDIHEWVHDESIKIGGKVLKDEKGKPIRTRPDYWSQKLQLVIEFDGLPHYTNPDVILKDVENTLRYNKAGYRVVRIPYFIQLSRNAVKTLFGVDVNLELFDESIPSLGVKGRNTPAYLCYEGIKRMAKEFARFPEQYAVNVKALKETNNPFLTGVDLLEKEYKRVTL